MSYTPVELRHVPVKRRLFGYDRESVEEILGEVADSFETVWRNRAELADRVEALEEELEELKARERALTNTLVAAEHAADELRERARREAELIVAEAHAEARSVMHTGLGERERLLAEVRRIESLLRSALGIVGEAAATAAPTAEDPAAQPVQPEPGRDDSREFPLSAAPPVAEPAPDAQQQPAAQPEPVAPEDEPPGWPPLRKVAQGGGADFDWGD